MKVLTKYIFDLKKDYYVLKKIWCHGLLLHVVAGAYNRIRKWSLVILHSHWLTRLYYINHSRPMFIYEPWYNGEPFSRPEISTYFLSLWAANCYRNNYSHLTMNENYPNFIKITKSKFVVMNVVILWEMELILFRYVIFVSLACEELIHAFRGYQSALFGICVICTHIWQ